MNEVLSIIFASYNPRYYISLIWKLAEPLVLLRKRTRQTVAANNLLMETDPTGWGAGIQLKISYKCASVCKRLFCPVLSVSHSFITYRRGFSLHGSNVHTVLS